jgi:hypothetical protein
LLTRCVRRGAGRAHRRGGRLGLWAAATAVGSGGARSPRGGAGRFGRRCALYSQALALDADNHVLYSNRAMAHIRASPPPRGTVRRHRGAAGPRDTAPRLGRVIRPRYCRRRGGDPHQPDVHQSVLPTRLGKLRVSIVRPRRIRAAVIRGPRRNRRCVARSVDGAVTQARQVQACLAGL